MRRWTSIESFRIQLALCYCTTPGFHWTIVCVRIQYSLSNLNACSHCSLTVPLNCGDVCNRPEVCINPPRNGAHKPPRMRCQTGSQHRGYTPGVPTVGLWLQRVESSAMQLGIIPIVWTWVIWYEGRVKREYPCSHETLRKDLLHSQD